MESHGRNLDDDTKAPLIPITQKPYPTPSSAATSSRLSPTLLSSILTLNTLYVLLSPDICTVTCFLVRLDGPPSTRNMLGVLGWVFAWWLTKPVPMSITSMAPLFLFPMFGISTADDVVRSYIDEVIALVLGSFILALAVEHYSIFRRLALNITLLRICATTAFVSMWMHNVSTTVMTMSVATGILQRLPEQSSCNDAVVAKFCKAVVLGVIYSAAIGRMSTLTGTGVNLILVGMWKSYFPDMDPISISQWFFFGFPLALLIFLATLCSLYCSRGSGRVLSTYLDKSNLKRELGLLGPIKDVADPHIKEIVKFAVMSEHNKAVQV